MDRAAARLIAVVLHRERVGARIGVRPPGNGLALDIRAQVLPLEVAQFVVCGEIRGRKTRTTLQADDFHASLAELGCEDSPGRTDADDDDISLFDCHRYALPCRPTIDSRVKACVLSRSSGVNNGWPPGKPTSRHPAKSLLPP
jgi:hypothetical protein